MDTLNGLECFVRSAEARSFAAAGRRLGLTPAAVGKNVARLEAALGVQLFRRSTRRLTLTEAGEDLLHAAATPFEALNGALTQLAGSRDAPSGTLKISLAPAFGREYILPLLGGFLDRYPLIRPDWRFENRPVDLIAEGYDAAIGGGFELPPGAIARELGPAHRVLLAAPAYLAAHPAPAHPGELPCHAGILIRSPQTGRFPAWTLRDGRGAQAPVELALRISVDDPEAACQAAAAGLGVALASTVHALPYLEAGTLLRVLPGWYVDVGRIAIYFPAQRLLAPKTRVFVDYVVERLRARQLAQRLSAEPGGQAGGTAGPPDRGR